MDTLTIKRLDYSKYEGKKYEATIVSDRYLSIEPDGDGFSIEWKTLSEPMTKVLTDDMLSEWLEEPVAYGAFVGEQLVGFAEGFLEKWNNRYRLTNICVFDNEARNSGVGSQLLDTIMVDAVNSKARMVVLETQSYNYKAISFYKKNGFEIIGFDRFAYSNNDPQEQNMRIEMGKVL